MAADLTFDVLAVDRATSAFNKMSRQVDRLGERLDRLDRKDVDVDIDTEDATRAGNRLVDTLSSGASSVSRNWIIAAGGIAAGLLVLPTLASAAVGGVVGAFGTGLAAVPAIFAAQNEKVRDEWSDTIDHMKAETRQLSEPFEPVLIEIADMVRTAFDDISPTLEKVFADLAPVIEDFAGHAIDALKELEPALEPMTQAFTDLLDEVGPRLPGIMDSLADAIESMAETVEENPDMFADLLEDAAMLAENLLKLIDAIATFNSWLNTVDAKIDEFREGLLDKGPTNPFRDTFDAIRRGWESLKDNLSGGATLTVDPRPALSAIGEAIASGGIWESRIFKAALGATTGGVFAALSISMGRGRSWARRVFRASFRATVAGVFSALAAAASAGRSWASRVFTATFNVRRVITSAVVPFLGRQHGGPVRAGQPVVVGERRPELFVPNTSGRIVPRVPTARPVTGGGGGHQRVVIELHSSGSDVDDMMMRILRRGVRVRGGDAQVVLGARR